MNASGGSIHCIFAEESHNYTVLLRSIKIYKTFLKQNLVTLIKISLQVSWILQKSCAHERKQVGGSSNLYHIQYQSLIVLHFTWLAELKHMRSS